jgi:hypothetical protein
VNTDATVFVDPSVTEPAAEVAASALVVSLKGSFQLSLHLGPRATGSSKVNLGAVEIQDAGRKGAIVSALPVTTAAALPITIEPDSDADLDCAFDTGDKSIATDAKTKLCDPAGVVISGTIEDSLQDRATPFASAVFHLTGCE